MPLDPLWKRALKAVVEIKDPPPPPPPEPIPQASYDELDGALKIQERREARQRLTPAPPPMPSRQEEPQGEPVDADGLVSFDALYAQANVRVVPFTAEQALDMLRNMPPGVSDDSRQQIINVTLSALGRSVGGTPEAIVADATRKQAALSAFRQSRGEGLADLTTAAEAHVADLQREIEKSQAIIAQAKRQYENIAKSCEDEAARLDTVVDFFSSAPAIRKL